MGRVVIFAPKRAFRTTSYHKSTRRSGVLYSQPFHNTEALRKENGAQKPCLGRCSPVGHVW